MTPEGKVKAKIKKVLKDNDIYYVMPATGGYGNSGAPDFLICLNGKFVGFETKANGNKPTALQEKHLSAIRSQGGFTLVVDETNIDALTRLLEQL